MRTDTMTRPSGSVLTDEKRKIAQAGLCRTCRHVGNCTLLAHATAPVHECEQFEVVSAVRRSVPELARNVYTAEPDRRFFGLCMNCEHRETCVFAKRNGGAWHCEEYS